MTSRAERAPGDPLVEDVVAWALLGEGPHCATWAGWSVNRWAPVVVKLPLPDANISRAAAALRREAYYLARLRHPAFPRVYAHGDAEDNPYLVLEAIEGRPLSERLERGALSWGDTMRLGLQLSSALRYLHATGIVHLDLKPANVLLRDGRVVVLDFGAAQAIGEEAPPGPRGTDGYMSAEQLAGEPASCSMDVWALGAVLREALCGQAGERASRRANWRLRRAPHRLRHLIEAAVADDAHRRPNSMTDVLAELMHMERSPRRGWTPEVARDLLPVTSCTALAVR